MQVSEIHSYIRQKHSEGKKMFVTSSFQSHSIPLLHILATSGVNIPVYFINTGFHFPETLRFRDEVINKLGMRMIDLHTLVPRNLQTDLTGHFYFSSDPDYCCFLNKTQPMEPVLAAHDIWINGVRADQNANRKNMKVEQPGAFNTLRFHPVLDWNSKMIFDYGKQHNLPKHPLEEKGYVSVGCEPCTRKMDLNDERAGRWFGMNKTECGLHTDLVK
jgi:phosphoadenosine phosphosulfate reductase